MITLNKSLYCNRFLLSTQYKIYKLGFLHSPRKPHKNYGPENEAYFENHSSMIMISIKVKPRIVQAIIRLFRPPFFGETVSHHEVCVAVGRTPGLCGHCQLLSRAMVSRESSSAGTPAARQVLGRGTGLKQCFLIFRSCQRRRRNATLVLGKKLWEPKRWPMARKEKNQISKSKSNSFPGEWPPHPNLPNNIPLDNKGSQCYTFYSGSVVFHKYLEQQFADSFIPHSLSLKLASIHWSLYY